MQTKQFTPLAERMRPTTLADFVGQKDLTADGQLLQQMLAKGKIQSMIFWGPPGVGKTTLAHIIAHQLDLPFFTLSAIDIGVKEVRQVIEMSRRAGHAILFIDEIHRFNKAQQDSLLGAVEKGIITLIGATTENPSFEVISALLSRSQVFVLYHLSVNELKEMVNRAMEKDEWLRSKNLEIGEWEALLQCSGGDGRKLLNLVELLAQNMAEGSIITNEIVQQTLQQKMVLYDKDGEHHYDIISAFIKSIRGSDPNAAVYWLARMLEGGEDPKFIARRMLILAAEDIGMANPNALLLANSTFQAVQMVGMPEGRIILSECALYLACSVKSNSSYMAIEKALSVVRQTGDEPVPLHLRNAPTGLMKDLNYGKDYAYAHAYENNFVELEFLPEKLKGSTLYHPGENGAEERSRQFLKERWGDKYEY